MSTYNGEQFLQEQLDSIYNQEDVTIKLIIRDDGSSDNTVAIIKEYQKRFENIQLIEGANIGCEESFKELLYMPIEADYYAFSDQDDVWHPNKLISAIHNINTYNCDLSVCNLMLADANMNIENPLFNDVSIKKVKDSFEKKLIDNLHGCVQVWTKKLHSIIQSYKPRETFGHDAWVNAIANCVSKTFVDSTCFINYRLHDNNTSGYARNLKQQINSGIRHYFLSKNSTNDLLCKNIIDGYSKYFNISDKKYNILKIVSTYKSNFRSRIELIFGDYGKHADFRHRCLFTLRVLFNRF